MSILITGSNGFVGQVLYKHLSLTRNVIGLCRQGNKSHANLFKLDLTKEPEVFNFFENHKGETITGIVHLAARMANKDNVNDLSILNDNTAISKNIALAAKAFGIKQIIYISSSSVYPNVDGTFDELSVTDPSVNADCVYGLSKLNGEVMLNYFAGAALNITHVRTAMIHGPGMEGTRIIPILQKEIAQNNSVTLFGNGERLLNLIHVNKLIEFITFFIEHPTAGIFNAAEECISLLELAKRIILENGNSQTQIILKPEGNKNKFILDVRKLNKLIAGGNGV